MSSATNNITSIGHACAVLNRPFGVVKSAADALSIKPAVHINGVPHFDDADVERIREHLAGEQHKER